MPHKDLRLLLLSILAGLFLLLALPGQAQQQVNLSDIGNATVTLYYYDKASETKGAIVPMPDNPQLVNDDPSKAAPGMFVFSQVPSGSWYYMEADHNGNKWYTIFFMEDNAGTKTANIHIPPLTPVNSTASPSPSVTPTPMATAVPAATSTPTPLPSPGMTFAAAGMALTMLAALLAFTRR
jgi:hypothetical protein